MTNSELLRDALGLIGVLSEVETPTAEQGAHGLRVLNEMMEEWEEAGVRLEYTPQTSTAVDFPGPPYSHGAVKANFAIRLAAYYGGGASVSESLVVQASEGYQRLLRRALTKGMREADLSHLPGGRGRYDIVSDS